MAKTEKSGDEKKGKMAARGMIFAFLILAAVFLPSAIVIGVCLIPSFVAALIDRQEQRTAWITVGAMNFAGTLPAWFALWEMGHVIPNALRVVTQPVVLMIAYGGAAVGWIIYHNVTPLVAAVVMGKNEKRLKSIGKQQKELVEKWGEEVTR